MDMDYFNKMSFDQQYDWLREELAKPGVSRALMDHTGILAWLRTNKDAIVARHRRDMAKEDAARRIVLTQRLHALQLLVAETEALLRGGCTPHEGEMDMCSAQLTAEMESQLHEGEEE